MLANLDCREYNNDSTIVVYVKDENGTAVPNAAVYVVPSSSGASTAYVPVHAKAAEPEKGIARYEGLSKSQTYGAVSYTHLPGLEIVGPMGNFAAFSVPSKLLLCFNMLAGRLEIFPILMLISRSTWKKD